MEIRQLRLFREVVDAGSISEAARRLNLSQPPLSYHMKMLEQELQVTLFQRGRRSIELTDAGRLLYERSQALLDMESTVSREITEAGSRRTLRIGVTPTTAPILIPALAVLNHEDASLRFEVFDGTTFTLREMMEKHLLDCTLLRTPVNTDGFQYASLGAEPFIAAGDHDFFREPGMTTLQELARVPLIIYRRYESLLRSAFADAGWQADIHCICDDARTAVLMAQEGMGIALLPLSIAPAASQSLPVRIIRENRLESEILFVREKQTGPDAVLDRLEQLLIQAR